MILLTGDHGLDPGDLRSQIRDEFLKLRNTEAIKRQNCQSLYRMCRNIVTHIAAPRKLRRQDGVQTLDRQVWHPSYAVPYRVAWQRRSNWTRAAAEGWIIMNLPLMPKATAVWLIDETALTFTQIADFCGMHPLEVQAIADGEVAQGIVGYNPVANSQVSQAEITRCEADPDARLQILPTANPLPKRSRGARYTPVAKRNDRPDAIAFVLRNFPQLSEAQVVKLLGTTKDTIQKVRERSHWNSSNIKPRDPVILGLCSQTDLNGMVNAANERLARDGKAVPMPPPPEAEEAA